MRIFATTGPNSTAILEEGRYRCVARERADLNRDYRERERQVRDIRHDYYR